MNVALQATRPSPLALLIELAGVHRFTYKKVTPDTGEVVWRWPYEPSLSEKVEPQGNLLDVRV